MTTRDRFEGLGPIERAAAVAEARDAQLAEGFERLAEEGARRWEGGGPQLARLSGGHAAAERRRAGEQPAVTKERERREQLAASFAPNEAYERFLRW